MGIISSVPRNSEFGIIELRLQPVRVGQRVEERERRVEIELMPMRGASGVRIGMGSVPLGGRGGKFVAVLSYNGRRRARHSGQRARASSCEAPPKTTGSGNALKHGAQSGVRFSRVAVITID